MKRTAKMTEADGERLLRWLETVSRLEALSNAALADLVLDHLWADLPLGTPQNDLLAEVIARLRGERGHEAGEERH
jgi:hypothetical protein